MMMNKVVLQALVRIIFIIVKVVDRHQDRDRKVIVVQDQGHLLHPEEDELEVDLPEVTVVHVLHRQKIG
jgi:hypothetical protein